MDTKTCTTCDLEKQINNFHKNTQNAQIKIAQED